MVYFQATSNVSYAFFQDYFVFHVSVVFPGRGQGVAGVAAHPKSGRVDLAGAPVPRQRAKMFSSPPAVTQ
jgi:hypothetical protein